MAPDIFVEKRDGRRVQFDVEKFIKPCWRRQKKSDFSHSCAEAKLETIVDRVIAEILERFPNGVKIYEIQMSSNMNCFKPMNMPSQRAILLIGRSGIWALKSNGYQLYDWKTP